MFNPYLPSSQKYRVYEMLKTGDKTGRDFLKVGILEYRSRINEVDKKLRLHGKKIKHYKHPDEPKFKYFGIRDYAEVVSANS